jgi:hypothetical protein
MRALTLKAAKGYITEIRDVSVAVIATAII